MVCDAVIRGDLPSGDLPKGDLMNAGASTDLRTHEIVFDSKAPNRPGDERGLAGDASSE